MVYKIILNGMPDENVNPIGTQTTQNDQAVTSQSGNDFVLDFGEGVEMTTANNIDSTGDVKLEDSDMSMENMGFGGEKLGSHDDAIQDMSQDDLFGEVKEEKEESSNQVDLESFYVENQVNNTQENDFNVGFENDFVREEKLDQISENSEVEQENVNLQKEGDLYDLPKSVEYESGQEGLDSQSDTVQGISTNKSSGEVDMELIVDEAVKTPATSSENNEILNSADSSDVVISENNFDGIKTEQETEGLEESFVMDNEENAKQIENNETVEENSENFTFNDEEIKYQVENKEEGQKKAEGLDESFVMDNEENAKQIENNETVEENSESFTFNDEENKNQVEDINNEKDSTDFMLTGDSLDNVLQESQGGEENMDKKDVLNDSTEIVKDENLEEKVDGDGNEMNDFRLDDSEERLSQLDEVQDDNSIVDSQVGSDFTSNDFVSEKNNMDKKEGVDSSVNKIQENESFENFGNDNEVNSGNTQPDMMDLLGGQSVDFSYEENAETIQQTENNLGSSQDLVADNQNELSINSQNPLDLSVENKANASDLINSSSLEEKSNLNVIVSQGDGKNVNELQNNEVGVSSEGTQSQVDNTNTGTPSVGVNTETQSVIANSVDNKANEVSQTPSNNISQVSENISNQSEIGQIKATLSLDEILDSELLSNPQFVDNSKAVPKNITEKPNKIGVSAFAWIGIVLLVGFVVVLAFPSISTERKEGDTVDTGSVIEDPTTPTYIPDEPEIPGDDLEMVGKDENLSGVHGASVEIEVVDDENDEDESFDDEIDDKIEDETVDEIEDEKVGDESTSSVEILPYVAEIEENEPIVEDEDSPTVSKADIQQKILTFKTKGEKYKQMGEEDSNKKVIKYATYVLRLCEEYEQSVGNEEGIDEEAFSEFETKVNGFLSKIEENLGLEEIETIYSN